MTSSPVSIGLLSYALFALLIKGENTVVIDTQLGRIRGVESLTKPTVYQLLGVQYAEAPIEDVRFLPPKLITSKWVGIYDVE